MSEKIAYFYQGVIHCVVIALVCLAVAQYNGAFIRTDHVSETLCREVKAALHTYKDDASLSLEILEKTE